MKKLLLIIGILFYLTSCQKKMEKQEFTMYDAFDTVITFTAYTNSEEEFETYRSIVEKEFKRQHRLYDPYHSYKNLSNVKTVNDNAGKKAVEVDPEFISLLLYTKENNQKYGDDVNIAAGRLTNTWKNYRDEALRGEPAKLPTTKELAEAEEHMDLKDIQIDKEKSTVFLKDEKMQLDFGAVAKGWATERVAEKLEAAGLNAGILNAGGNIRTIGDPKVAGREQWALGIQNPNAMQKNSDVSQILAVYKAKKTSLVTSGDYQRFYTVDGKKYHHILDPKTGFPASYFKSVTVACENSALADFLSTTLFIKNYNEGKKLVDSLEGVECIWVFPDNSIQTTKGFEKNLEIQDNIISKK